MSSSLHNQVSYLLRCQVSAGAFRLAPHDNRINPYFTNLALPALVLSGEIESVKHYLEWFLAHVTTKGYINDYSFTATNDLIDTGKADSEDSYIATFFSLLVVYIEQTNDVDWLLKQQSTLLKMLHALLLLQQKDGLTWAKSAYRVKYLMDNCEVWKGLTDAVLLFNLLGDAQSAHLAYEKAALCKKGILDKWSPKKKSFPCYDSTYPAWKKWYPDVTSQAFPIVFGILSPNDQISRELYSQITLSFPYFDMFQTGDLFPWMIMGECAFLMGDERRVNQMLSMAEDVFIYGPSHRYWLLHEAGFYLKLSLISY